MADDAKRAAVSRLLDAFGTTEARRLAAALDPRALRLVDRVIAERCAVRLLSQGEARTLVLDRLEAGHVGSRRSAQRLLAQVAPRQNSAPDGAPRPEDRASSPNGTPS